MDFVSLIGISYDEHVKSDAHNYIYSKLIWTVENQIKIIFNEDI